jgi:hypothetical protein
MQPRPRYYPPAINVAGLKSSVLAQYPSHRGSLHLIDSLISEYIKFWRLILSYRDKRIVATGPILAVQQVHQQHREEYFADCMHYFNRYVPAKEMAWGGSIDVRGAVQTVASYNELFQEPPPLPWADITALFSFKRTALRIV